MAHGVCYDAAYPRAIAILYHSFCGDHESVTILKQPNLKYLMMIVSRVLRNQLVTKW